jgi:hypothetical protein
MSKAKLTALALVALLITGSGAANSAAAPKPGTKCTKAGLTQTVSGKKYTCTKSGAKLVWSKGVAVAPKLKPTQEVTSDPSPVAVEPNASSSPSLILTKYKNCTEVKAAGIAPLTKANAPELYELNAGLDRDKDGVACEN